MREPSKFVMSMKPFSLFFLSFIFGPFVGAQTGESGPASLTMGSAASVQEAPVSREPAASSRLRDLFQKSTSAADESIKPFRLTAEERMHLREQLRGQFALDMAKP